MHDPCTLAFSIRYPWRSRKPCSLWPKGYRSEFIQIWHVDPEHRGSDDSCDWFNARRKYTPAELAVKESLWDLETILDNKPFYPDHKAHRRFQSVKEAVYKLGKKKRFRIHPRWHIWHWEIKIVPLVKFKRWAFTKCEKCGNGFGWDESALGTCWEGTGPLWFRSETNTQHMSCAGIHLATAPPASGLDEKGGSDK